MRRELVPFSESMSTLPFPFSIPNAGNDLSKSQDLHRIALDASDENGNRQNMKIFRNNALLILLAAVPAGGLWLTTKSVARAWSMGDWSDASRQWEVCQYVKARINPYELAFRLLLETYGPATGPNRILLREHRI